MSDANERGVFAERKISRLARTLLRWRGTRRVRGSAIFVHSARRHLGPARPAKTLLRSACARHRHFGGWIRRQERRDDLFETPLMLARLEEVPRLDGHRHADPKVA